MSGTTPKLSILMPVFNMQKYLGETLDTVLSQTFKDFEIIIMDGASKDGTIERAREYAEKDSRIRVFSEPDESPYEAVHKALKLARGKFVAILCASDGYVSQTWLENAVSALEKDAELSLVWGVPFDMSEDGTIIGPHFVYAHFLKTPGPGKKPSVLKRVLGRLDIFHPSTFITFLRKINPSNIRAFRDLYSKDEPLKKEAWFYYWLRTGTVFPDGNMCMTRRALEDCLPSYALGTREPGDWMDFYFRFNSRGYLSAGLPVPANFGRLHGGQVSEKVQGYNDEKRRIYFAKLANFRAMLQKDASSFHFINQEGQPLTQKIDSSLL